MTYGSDIIFHPLSQYYNDLSNFFWEVTIVLYDSYSLCRSPEYSSRNFIDNQ